VALRNGNLVIKAHDVRLGDLLEKISNVCQVDVKGLANIENEKISFVSGNEPIEYEFKRLLRHLNIDNYAFEYSGDRLRFVSVYLKSEADNPEPPFASNAPREIEKRQSKAVKVLDILEESQAETLNLMPGDLVISYDGARISTANQLIKLVKSKPDSEVVDMTVLRDGRKVNLVLNGGRIGIRIKTVAVTSGILNPD
jgi:hypothetical protein